MSRKGTSNISYNKTNFNLSSRYQALLELLELNIWAKLRIFDLFDYLCKNNNGWTAGVADATKRHPAE